MKPFPRFRTLTDQVPPVDITQDTDSTQKWVTPRKHAKTKTLCIDNISNEISTKNKYVLLTDQTDNVDFSTQHVTEKGATQSICDVDEAETIHNYQVVQPKSKSNKHNNIINLSNCKLTTEVSVLELGLSFCPTTKYLNKQQTTNNFYSFIRCLKIFQYLHGNFGPAKDSQHATNDVDTRRDILDWRKRNPDWYPNDVKKTIRRTCIIH